MECNDRGCSRPARMSVRAIRKPEHRLHVESSSDPLPQRNGWLPYCKEHGIAATAELLGVLVGSDSVPDIPAPKEG